MSVKIKKAKIVEDLFLYVEYQENVEGSTTPNDLTNDSKIPIHEDLRNAVQKLHKHLAVMCEEVTVKGRVKSIEDFDTDALWLTPEVKDGDDFDKDKADGERLPKFTARSFSIGGKNENEGVTISGMKRLKNGKVVNLNTPFTKWSDEEYIFIRDLASDIETCIYEVEQYLFHDKRAPEKQLSLFDEQEEESLVEEAL